jgi:hypothetical protein
VEIVGALAMVAGAFFIDDLLQIKAGLGISATG